MKNNLISAIEDSIGSKLTNKVIDKLDVKMLANIGHSVNAFFKKYKLPEKSSWEYRPYIFHRFKISKDFSLFESLKEQDGYDIDNSPFFDSLKRLLLYCHSVCLHDGLSYVLDYFTLDDSSTVAKEKIFGARCALKSYVAIAPLIRENIVIPVSDFTYGFYFHNQFLIEQELEEMIAEFGGTGIETVQLLASCILEQQYINKKLESKTDLYFPHIDFTYVLKGICHAYQKAMYTDESINTALTNFLIRFKEIDPSIVSIADIVTIRKNEEDFYKLRKILRDVVSEVDLHSLEILNADMEWKRLIHDFQSEVNRIYSKTDKLSKKIFKHGKAASFGMVSSVVSGLFAQADPKIVIGSAIVGSGVGGALGVIGDLFGFLKNQKRIKSVKHHFLALGAE